MSSRPTPPASLASTADASDDPLSTDLRTQLRRDDVCVHIFTASSTLVGVCVTVIGLLRLIRRLQGVTSIADVLLGIDALGFLGSCVIAYAALRTGRIARRRRIERLADGTFLVSLALMAVVCILIAFELV